MYVHLTDRVSLGVTGHYIVNRIGRVDATATSLRAGLQYANLGGVSGLDLGVALKHIGTQMQYEGSGLLNRGQVNGLRRGPFDYNVRVGFDYAADSSDDYLYGTSFGFGLNLDAGAVKDLRVDYAYTTVDFFDALNTFSFQFGF